MFDRFPKSESTVTQLNVAFVFCLLGFGFVVSMSADWRRSYYSAISLCYYYVETTDARLKLIRDSIFVFAVRMFSVSQPPATYQSPLWFYAFWSIIFLYKIPWRKSVVAIQFGSHFYYRFQLTQGDIHCLCLCIIISTAVLEVSRRRRMNYKREYSWSRCWRRGNAHSIFPIDAVSIRIPSGWCWN